MLHLLLILQKREADLGMIKHLFQFFDGEIHAICLFFRHFMNESLIQWSVFRVGYIGSYMHSVIFRQMCDKSQFLFIDLSVERELIDTVDKGDITIGCELINDIGLSEVRAIKSSVNYTAILSFDLVYGEYFCHIKITDVSPSLERDVFIKPFQECPRIVEAAGDVHQQILSFTIIPVCRKMFSCKSYDLIMGILINKIQPSL